MDTSIIEIVVAILATWRLSALLYYDAGPFECFQKLREWASDYKFLGGLLECFWCVSIWIGFACTAAILCGCWWVLFPFALSAGAILLSHGGDEIWREQT